MTQKQLPEDLKKIVLVLVAGIAGIGGSDIEVGSFSVGAHNTASWVYMKQKYYCHLSQITLVATGEKA